MAAQYRNPQAEADDIVGDGRSARVLEPSPPAVTTGPWFADDPAAVADPERTTAGQTDGRAADRADVEVVTPTSAGDLRWSDLAASDETVAAFCQPRWLANHRALTAVPDHYPTRRDDLHRLAYGVVSSTRKAANGKFGLRWTMGGFGTPFFGEDAQVRVQDRLLVAQRGPNVEAETITTLGAAAKFLGVEAASDQAEHDTVALGDLNRPLTVDEELVAFISDWFGMATAALEELRCTPRAPDPSRVQLWPGHFDVATEIGDAEANLETEASANPDAETEANPATEADPVTRATYGASPGDAAHPEPYLYVGPWGPVDAADPFWNDTAFTGASLPFAALTGDPNPCEAALDFYRQALKRLTGG